MHTFGLLLPKVRFCSPNGCMAPASTTSNSHGTQKHRYVKFPSAMGKTESSRWNKLLKVTARGSSSRCLGQGNTHQLPHTVCASWRWQGRRSPQGWDPVSVRHASDTHPPLLLLFEMTHPTGRQLNGHPCDTSLQPSPPSDPTKFRALDDTGYDAWYGDTLGPVPGIDDISD